MLRPLLTARAPLLELDLSGSTYILSLSLAVYVCHDFKVCMHAHNCIHLCLRTHTSPSPLYTPTCPITVICYTLYTHTHTVYTHTHTHKHTHTHTHTHTQETALKCPTPKSWQGAIRAMHFVCIYVCVCVCSCVCV